LYVSEDKCRLWIWYRDVRLRACLLAGGMIRPYWTEHTTVINLDFRELWVGTTIILKRFTEYCGTRIWARLKEAQDKENGDLPTALKKIGMELNSYQLQDVHLRQNKSNRLSISGNTNYMYLKMSMWILTRLLAGKSCFDSWQQKEIFLFSGLSWPTMGAHPFLYWKGTPDLFLG